MLKKILEEYKNAFSAEDIECVENSERELLYFDELNSKDILNLGKIIVEKTRDYGDIAIIVRRLKDNATVFQYIGDLKGERNIGFALMKEKTVLNTGHCSLWALMKYETDGEYRTLIESGECLPVGGSFPVFINNELAFTFSVSGLHEGKDFSKVVEAFAEFENKDVPSYRGKLI